MKHTAVVWDVDGTLLNTREGVVSAAKYVLEHLKFDGALAGQVVVFPKIKDAFKELFDMNEEQACRATVLFRERYKTRDLLKATVYDGVYDVMEALRARGVKQAVATNKRQDYATEICEHFGFDKYCFPIVGADNDNKLTKADLIKKCLQTLGVADASSAVMIGDTNGDKTAAETVGVDFIGVNYGFGFHGVAGYADGLAEVLNRV